MTVGAAVALWYCNLIHGLSSVNNSITLLHVYSYRDEVVVSAGDEEAITCTDIGEFYHRVTSTV